MNIYEALEKSDDYELHKELFVLAASLLIAQKVLAMEEFDQHGGGVRSVTVENCYFVFANSAITPPDKFYLNVKKRQLLSRWEKEPYQL